MLARWVSDSGVLLTVYEREELRAAISQHIGFVDETSTLLIRPLSLQ